MEKHTFAEDVVECLEDGIEPFVAPAAVLTSVVVHVEGFVVGVVVARAAVEEVELMVS